MALVLTPIEARVIGCLVEKAATTPDNYPLSTNSLRLACNQTTNRDPVVDYSERELDTVMLELRQRGLARTIHGQGRVSKHKHVLDDALGLASDELAVLAVLLLRGPQTVAELTARTERYAGGPQGFAAVDDVVDRLAARNEPLVVRLARRPGEREPRIAHIVGDPDAPIPEPAQREHRPPGASLAGTGGAVELDALRARVDQLEEALAEQRARLDRLVDELGA
jgi:hypothetical protein